VQGSSSSQEIDPPAQTPALQRSLSVQRSPSSQGDTLWVNTQPEEGSGDLACLDPIPAGTKSPWAQEATWAAQPPNIASHDSSRDQAPLGAWSRLGYVHLGAPVTFVATPPAEAKVTDTV
jgi:hypothetical protein